MSSGVPILRKGTERSTPLKVLLYMGLSQASHAKTLQYKVEQLNHTIYSKVFSCSKFRVPPFLDKQLIP